MARLGVVAIGRNEGERLRRCLISALTTGAAVVYVDSGSSDGSVKLAQTLGARVVPLDLSIPFTAARARNAGFERLLAEHPDLAWVQFIDGDCELAPEWMEPAVRTLRTRLDVAAVCGRRRERFPEASVYNQLCDLEWNTPVGEAQSFGGDVLIRVCALRQVGGYDPALIAGEEPELCVRLRRRGWKILRLDAEMTRHDAALWRFSQWWTRTRRAGHAYAEGYAMHGRGPERFRAQEVRSIAFWGLGLPVAVVALAEPSGGLSLLVWALALRWLAERIRRSMRARDFGEDEASLYAVFTLLGKLPQALGMLRYVLGRLSGQRSRVIEYKPAAPARGIAYLAGVFPARSETFVYREVRALRARGWRVVTLALNDSLDRSDPHFADLSQDHWQLYRGATTGWASLAEAFGHPLRSLLTLSRVLADAALPGEPLSLRERAKLAVQGAAALGLARHLRAEGVRHVHCHFAHAPTTLGMYAAGHLGLLFSFTGHANDLFQRRILLKRKLARAAFVACISEWHREFYATVEPTRSSGYAVVRCGVDLAEWRPAERAKADDTSPFALLSVCRLVAKKGMDTAIQALSVLRTQGIPARLRIAGEGPDRERLQALAQALGVAEDVSFLGAVDNARVRELLGQANVMVLPCRTDAAGDRDGLPVVLIEAMACGLPVVAGDLPAIRELVRPESSGLLVPGDDPAALAEALRRLHADPALAARLGAAGRQRVEAEFALEPNVARLERLIESAVCGTVIKPSSSQPSLIRGGGKSSPDTGGVGG